MPPTKAESTALLDKPVGSASWWRPLEPSLVVATANLLAAVWQETFYTYVDEYDIVPIRDDGALRAIVACLFIAGVMLLFSASLSVGQQHQPKTTTVLQVLNGWMLKSVVDSILSSAEIGCAASLSTGGVASGPALVLSCIAASVAIALLWTAAAAGATALLPEEAPSAACSPRNFGLYMARLLTGSTFLPTGYAWNEVKELVAQALHAAWSREGWSDGALLVRIVLTHLVLTSLLLVLLAVLKHRTHRWLRLRADEEGLGGYRARLLRGSIALADKTYVYLIAWSLWAVVEALWGGQPGNATCFAPAERWNGLYLSSSAMVALVLLIALAFTALNVVAAASPSCANPRCLATTELGALAWGIVLGSLAPQLGWAWKEFVTAVSDYATLLVVWRVTTFASIGLLVANAAVAWVRLCRGGWV